MHMYTKSYTTNSMSRKTAMTRPTHTATQDSDINKVWHREVGSQKQTAPCVANTPIRSGLNLASTHQMAPPSTHHLIKALLLIYRPRKDERLSWPSLLTCSGRFTHIVVRLLVGCIVL